nr:pleckstrin/ G-protein interacting- domain protein [Crocosphaera sp.]
VEIKDRRHRLKQYPKCFIGSDLVDWMIKNLSISSEQAVKIGQQLIDKKIIHHVHDQHDFENQYLFYRFYVDE